MPVLNREMTPEEIEAFRAPYRLLKQKGEVSALLRRALLAPFQPLKSYARGDGKSAPEQFAEAIEDAFYADGDNAGRHRLTPQNRERVLIPLLASRSDDFALAVHVYLGWLEGLEDDEIGELIFLGGIYTGISHLARGLDVVNRTFAVVTAAGSGVQFPEMLGKLKAAFTPAPAPPPSGRGAPGS